MRAAFHFDAQPFGNTYGFPITELFFRKICDCIPSERRNLFVRRGDLTLPETVRNAVDVANVAEEIRRCARTVWTTVREGVLAAVFMKQPWVFAVEGISLVDANALDSHLSEIGGYLGAIEVYLGNPYHWGIYDRNLPAAYRLVGDELRLFHMEFDPETREEPRRHQWAGTGIFRRVEWEDTGLRDTVFDDFSDFEHAKRVAEIEDRLGEQFGPLAGTVLMRLAVLDPSLPDSLHAAVVSLDRAESAEQLAQVSLSCRRFLTQLANALYSARPTQVNGRNVGPDAYRNRLWAYVEEHFPKGDKSRVLGTFAEVGRRLDAIDKAANKQIHGPEINRDAANRLVLALAVWTYDVLTLTPPPGRARLEPYRRALDAFVKNLLRRRGGELQ